MGPLAARVARHRGKYKSRHWHIDYLTLEADSLVSIQVRSLQRLERKIAQMTQKLLVVIFRAFTGGRLDEPFSE